MNIVDPDKLNRNQLKCLTIDALLNLGKHLSGKTKRDFIIDAVVEAQIIKGWKI